MKRAKSVSRRTGVSPRGEKLKPRKLRKNPAFLDGLLDADRIAADFAIQAAVMDCTPTEKLFVASAIPAVLSAYRALQSANVENVTLSDLAEGLKDSDSAETPVRRETETVQ